MKWMNAGLTAAVLFSAPVLADDAQQTATTTMREAMAEQASMPAGPHAKAGDPSSDAKPKPDTQQVTTMKHSPGAQHSLAADQAARQAHQHATVDGTTQADSMHAAMANNAAMGAMRTTMMGGATGTCQGGSDCQNAAGMTRSMSPGAGMMGGSTSGGSTTGGATPGSPGTTTGGSSTPMGGKR
jgi:hypothetical protein